MRRVGIGLVVALVLGAALMAATARTSATAGTAGAKADNITIWVGWSAAELKAFKAVVAEYDQKHSDVTVKVVGGINDDKITAAIRSGKVPDVVSSFTSANVGQYCNSGAWLEAMSATTTAASVATRYGCQRERKVAPMTGSANTIRKSGLCTPPACCQMNATVMTPSACSAVSVRASRIGLRVSRVDKAVKPRWIAPRVSSPIVVAATSTSSPLMNQGSAIAGTMVNIVNNHVSSSG